MGFNVKVTKCSNCPWFIPSKSYMSVAALSGCEWDYTDPKCGGEKDPYKYPPTIEDSSIMHPDCPRQRRRKKS